MYVYATERKNVWIGAVIGGHSVVTKGLYTSNTVYAGNSAQKRKEDIFFTRESAYDFTEYDSKKIEEYQRERISLSFR